MTAQELAEAKAELAALKAARLKRLLGKQIGAVGSTGETVTYASVTTLDIETRIRELQFEIALATGRGGALHIR